MPRKTYVLDSFAVLALLGAEEGSDQVSRLLQEAQEGEVHLAMTWVNAGEVAHIVERRWGKERMYQILATLEATAIEFLSVGRRLSLAAAAIKAEHPLAYADAFAAGLAASEDGVLVTGDPEFMKLEGTVDIQWLS